MHARPHDDARAPSCGCNGAREPVAGASGGCVEPTAARGFVGNVDPDPGPPGVVPLFPLPSGATSAPVGKAPASIGRATRPRGRAPEPIPDPERLGENGVEVWVAKHGRFKAGAPSGRFNPFAPRPPVRREPELLDRSAAGVGPDCTHAPIDVSIYAVEPIRDVVCAVDLGTSREPTLRDGRFGPGRLRAVLDPAFEPGPAEDPLRSIVRMFPDLQLRSRGFLGVRPTVGSTLSGPWDLRLVGQPRMGQGLFFPVDRYEAVVGLALRVVATFPELLVPTASLRDCSTSPEDLASFADGGVVVHADTPYNPMVARQQRLEVEDGVLTGRRIGRRPRYPGPEYVGMNPPYGPGILLAPVVDLDCAIADYLFWWAHRLSRFAQEFPGFSPSGSDFLDAETWRRDRDWYALMSDLCARLAMTHTLRIGALVVHEMLHRYHNNHCEGLDGLSRQSLACCQNRVQQGFFEAARALFGLPLPGTDPIGRAALHFQDVTLTFDRFEEPFFRRQTVTLGGGCTNDGVETEATARHASFLARRHCVQIESRAGRRDPITGVLTAECGPFAYQGSLFCGGSGRTGDREVSVQPRIGSELDGPRLDPNAPDPLRPDRRDPR
jgi:hypothetical protein